MEKWRDVVGYEGLYQVSDLGRVKSMARRVPRKIWGSVSLLTVKARIRKSNPACNGYPVVMLSRGGKRKLAYVHQMMLEAFVGPRPSGKWGLHRDDNKENNRLSNLRWGIPKENSDDSRRNGTIACGEKVGTSKATKNTIRIARSLSKDGFRQREIARMLRLSQGHVSSIVNNHVWKHI